MDSFSFIDAHVHLASWKSLKECKYNIVESSKSHNIGFCLISNADAAEFPSIDTRCKKGKSTLFYLRQSIEFAKKQEGHVGVGVWIRPFFELPDNELVSYINANRKYIYFIKFHPYCEKLKITSRKLLPWIRLTRELGFPLLVHTALDEYSSILELEKVAKDNKDINFIAAHLELCSDNEVAINVMKDNPNIYADTAWVKIDKAKRVLEEVGDSRIMFGSDNPIDGLATLDNPMYQDYFSNTLDIEPSLYKKLMRENAIKVYKLPLK